VSSQSLSELLAERTLWLCEQPSVITFEEALCEALQQRVAPLCRRVQRVGNSLVCWGPRKGRPLVGLFGHLDTVPKHPESRPTQRDGDRIYGLGASDMKSGLAIMWTLLEQLDLDALPYDLVAVFYDQEEGPFVDNGLGPTLEQIPELLEIGLGFALEPSDNVVQVGAVGTMHAAVVFEGRACHSARPWQGENAVHKAGVFLTELDARQAVTVDCGGFAFREVMSVTGATGGRARNIIPERFELNVNYRFAPGKDLEQAKQDVLDFVAGRARVEFLDPSPSGRVVTRANPLFDRFLSVTGAEVAPKQAWTDVARLTQAGIDAVNFGPGLSSQAHQKDEYVRVDLIEQGYRMFQSFLCYAPGLSSPS